MWNIMVMMINSFLSVNFCLGLHNNIQTDKPGKWGQSMFFVFGLNPFDFVSGCPLQKSKMCKKMKTFPISRNFSLAVCYS